MKDTLPYLAALHSLGTLHADAMRSAVDSLMNQGFYADECLAALDSKPARTDEVLPAFHAALRHFRVAVPDLELAVWQLIEHHLRRVLAVDGDPWASLRDLIRDTYWDYDFASKARSYLGDSHAIEEIIGIYWDIDSQAEEAGVPPHAFSPSDASLNAIRLAAQEWLQRRPPKNAA